MNHTTKEKVNIDGIYYELDESTKTAKVIHGQEKYANTVDIPSTVVHNDKEYKVTAIGDKAFWLCSDLRSIYIPYGVTYIGDRAFLGCTGLTSIDIPDSVTTIAERAFHGCNNLKSIRIPNSATNIGHGAFFNCI